MNRFFMGEVRSRVASTRNDKKRQIKMRGAGDAHAFAIVAYSTKTFKDEPSSPRNVPHEQRGNSPENQTGGGSDSNNEGRGGTKSRGRGTSFRNASRSFTSSN